MDVLGAARAIFKATRNTPASVAAIRVEYAALALALATDPAASQVVTSATVNGQTFTAAQGMTQGQRLRLLELIVEMYDRNKTISRVAKPYF